MEEKIIKTKGLARYPLMFGGIIFVVSALLALNILGLRRGFRVDNDEATQIVGMFFLGLSLVPLGLGLSLARRGKGLRLSPTGFHDPQMFRNEIPWSALQAVEYGTSNNKRETAVRLKVTPEAYEAAKVVWLAKAVVADPQNGIGYTAKLIESSLEDFANEIVAYANEALQRAQ